MAWVKSDNPHKNWKSARCDTRHTPRLRNRATVLSKFVWGAQNTPLVLKLPFSLNLEPPLILLFDKETDLRGRALSGCPANSLMQRQMSSTTNQLTLTCLETSGYTYACMWGVLKAEISKKEAVKTAVSCMESSGGRQSNQTWPLHSCCIDNSFSASLACKSRPPSGHQREGGKNGPFS